MADGRCDGIGHSSPHALNFVYAPGIGVVRATSGFRAKRPVLMVLNGLLAAGLALLLSVNVWMPFCT